jgi:hypothetical protein
MVATTRPDLETNLVVNRPACLTYHLEPSLGPPLLGDIGHPIANAQLSLLEED